MRASSYNIYVDLPDNPEDMLLVHGYTGAYDRVNRRVATFLRSKETGRVPRPLYGEWSPEPEMDGGASPPSDETIAVLQRRGYLTELTPEAEVEHFTKVAAVLHQENRQPSYIFMPTYDCNLRCGYCFQDEMRTNPALSHLLRVITRDVVDRIFNAMPQIEQHHGLPGGPEFRKTMGFFGGEPLLARLRPIIEYIVEKAADDSGAVFWAITNGTELEAYKDLLRPDRIYAVQITVDGPPEEHDRRRIRADGSGSFDDIARNLEMALTRGVMVNVRMNIDRTNVDQLPALADEIVARGWNQSPFFGVYTAPVVYGSQGQDKTKTMGSWELDKALDRMREEHENMRVIGRPDDRLASKVYQIFDKRSRPDMQPAFCGAHNGMYVFDAFGDAYACWERTGDPRIRIAHVDENGDFQLEQMMNLKWRSRNVTTNPTCQQCRFALYCGGGCAVLAEGGRGEFFTNFCDGFAARFRSSVADAYGKHIRGEMPAPVIDAGCED